ncbi:MAG TPA: glycoside hydrolase family 76 protein [Chthonomonadales bacterium]|nr:glycoside hydrolase family 76 protein [Chthonomonadales bacterium]
MTEISRRELLVGAPLLPVALAQPQPNWAIEAALLTDRVQTLFWDPRSAMYRAPVHGPETVPSGPAHDRGYVLWPSIEMFHALVEAELCRPGRWRDQIAAVYDGLEKYRHPPAHAYNAWLDFPGNVDRYYDDNAILVRLLVKATRATGDPRYRARARDVLENFVRRGWDPSGEPGGMLWGVDPSRQGTSDRVACSTSMTALAALELAGAGVDVARNVEWAEALMDWLVKRLLDTDGLVMDGLVPPDYSVRRVKWTYNTGLAIQAHVLLWRRTRRRERLELARTMGEAAIRRTGSLYDGLVRDPERNFWWDSSFFTAYLADGLTELWRVTRDARLRAETLRNAAFAYQYVRDPSDNLYFRNWRLWRIDRPRWELWRRRTGIDHPLEPDEDERGRSPDNMRRPVGERPVVKSLLSNAGATRLLWIVSRL